jgi:hypothetical protein
MSQEPDERTAVALQTIELVKTLLQHFGPRDSLVILMTAAWQIAAKGGVPFDQLRDAVSSSLNSEGEKHYTNLKNA